MPNVHSAIMAAIDSWATSIGKSADAATNAATAPSSLDPKRADRKSPGVAQPLRRK